MPVAESAVLQQAIARNTAVTIRFRVDTSTRECRSRFVGADLESIWLEVEHKDLPQFDALREGRASVAANFRHETSNVLFDAPVLGGRRDFPLNGSTHVAAVQVAMPKSLSTVQRREDYRVAVPGDGEMVVRTWRVGDADDLRATPAAKMEMHVTLRDLSNGGLGGVFHQEKGGPIKLVIGQRLRISVVLDDASLLLDSRLRYIGTLPDAGKLRVGIQFEFKPDSAADRQTLNQLNKLLGELQRRELRRKKLR